jgi:Predicted secreted protein
MKKILWMAAVLFMAAGLFRMDAHAQSIQQEEGRTVVALGADLTEQQKDTVLGLMGITREQLADYEVVTITNAQEHQYLDAYLGASVIGSKSLSSVLLKKGAAGSGVYVTTKNINYCTTGMYRNALLTAGVQDTEVIVAAPAPISGTAALIGAVKAYEKMEGTTISDASLSNALNELITTGELAEAAKNVSSGEIEQLIAWLKEKVAKGELDSDADIRKAVEEGEAKFGVSLTDEEVQMILDLMNQLESMGLNSEYLLSQAEKLYNKYGTDIVAHADEAISEAVSNAVSDAADGVWQNIKKSVKDFWNSLFG